MAEPSTPGRPRSTTQTVVRQLAPYAALGWQMAITICVLGAIGWWIDGLVETSPTWLLVGLVLGAVLGMVQFFRSVAQLSQRIPKDSSET